MCQNIDMFQMILSGEPRVLYSLRRDVLQYVLVVCPRASDVKPLNDTTDMYSGVHIYNNLYDILSHIHTYIYVYRQTETLIILYPFHSLAALQAH